MQLSNIVFEARHCLTADCVQLAKLEVGPCAHVVCQHIRNVKQKWHVVPYESQTDPAHCHCPLSRHVHGLAGAARGMGFTLLRHVSCCQERLTGVKWHIR